MGRTHLPNLPMNGEDSQPVGRLGSPMAISTEERRIVTVLFADMAGSTALGEQLDPEEMRRILARYYRIARDSVEQHGGTVRAANNFEFGDQIDIEARGKSAPVAAHVVIGPRKAKARQRARLPLIGRENDLAQLQLVARRAVNEKRPSMVSVIAPAGVGKTRLVEEFLAWLPSLAPDAMVATAQCLPYGQQLTYWPMRQVLFALTGSGEDTPPGQVREAIWNWLKRMGVEDPARDARP